MEKTSSFLKKIKPIIGIAILAIIAIVFISGIVSSRKENRAAAEIFPFYEGTWEVVKYEVDDLEITPTEISALNEIFGGQGNKIISEISIFMGDLTYSSSISEFMDKLRGKDTEHTAVAKISYIKGSADRIPDIEYSTEQIRIGNVTFVVAEDESLIADLDPGKIYLKKVPTDAE